MSLHIDDDIKTLQSYTSGTIIVITPNRAIFSMLTGLIPLHFDDLLPFSMFTIAGHGCEPLKMLEKNRCISSNMEKISVVPLACDFQWSDTTPPKMKIGK